MNQRSKIKACVLRGVQVFGFLYIQLSLSSRQPTATDFTSTVLCPLSAPSCHPLLTAHPSISETTHRPSAARVGTELCCYPDCLRLRSYSKCLKRREPSSLFFFFFKLATASHFSSLHPKSASSVRQTSVTVSSALISPCSLASPSSETHRPA